MANGPAPALARHMHRHVPLLRALPLYLLLSAERGLRLVCGVQDGPIDASGNRRLFSFREHIHHRGGALSYLSFELETRHTRDREILKTSAQITLCKAVKSLCLLLSVAVYLELPQSSILYLN